MENNEPIKVKTVPEEYKWIEEHFGKRGIGWELVEQMLLGSKSEYFDILKIKLANGTIKNFEFELVEGIAPSLQNKATFKKL